MTKRKDDPRVSVTVEGRSLPLHFTMGAIHDLMDATGINVLKGLEPEAMQDPRTMMAFVWAMAGGPDSGYATPRDLAKVVEPAELGVLAKAVSEVMTASRPLA